uniref:Galactosyltransferase N-terminal domain-containing protein n=1 Tax=Laticauda laticaudata TaxID=8630 RepID=A0A8C5T313_LATLA
NVDDAPFVSGSAGLPGSSLQKACRLLVVFCALHLSAVLFYYLRGNTVAQGRSPEPPPRSQTFGRRESESLLPTNSSKPVADCPDPSPLLRKCGAPRPLLRSPASPAVGAPSFSPGPAFKCHLPPTISFDLILCFFFLLPVGSLHVEFSQIVNLKNVEKENPELREGGHYTPKDCKALQKVAIIIPFRNRDEHLKYWLFYLHPILQRQQLDYGVYVINQRHVRDVSFFWVCFCAA